MSCPVPLAPRGGLSRFSLPLLWEQHDLYAVEGGGTEQVVFATPRTSLPIYWGSIDGNQGGNLNNNSLTVDGFTLTGADLVAMFGASGRGDQSSPAGNQLVTISGLGAFTTVTFSSTRNAFEFSLAAVPEPSTWAMMALGFAGLATPRSAGTRRVGRSPSDRLLLENMRRAAARRPFLFAGRLPRVQANPRRGRAERCLPIRIPA